ncbi:MAG: MMPL family transporter [Bacteroidia bacterium]|nr:MMPL family transporter [Bacteroidia bacterium]
MNSGWQTIATSIIRVRVPILIVLGLVTFFMFTQRGTETVQAFSQLILTDEDVLEGYEKLQTHFGDDANLVAVSMDADFSSMKLYNGLYDLTRELEETDAVNSVVSLCKLYDIERVDSPGSFKLVPLVQRRPESQEEVDSLTQRLQNLPFYDGFLQNDSARTTLMAISLDPDRMNTDEKVAIVERMQKVVDAFAEEYNVKVRYAGLPILRATFHASIREELVLFLGIAMIITAITLLLFFRSLYTMIFPMLVVGCVIIFSMGLIGLFGFKLNLITGIIPALITVITIPNSVYLITKYHIEFLRTRNKMKSLILVVEKIGIVTVMTNATTAIGFAVLAITEIQPMREFGIVASLSVVAAFFISLLLIPIVFSFLPPPTKGQTKHLQRRGLNVAINLLDVIVLKYRWAVMIIAVILVGISLWGMTLVVPVAYMADDIPQDSDVVSDLKYIENEFNGAFPIEILIDAKKPRQVNKRRNLERLSRLQDSLATYNDISRSISIADFAKFFRQAFFEGGREDYDLPTRNEYNFIADYVRNTQMFQELTFSKNLTDSTFQITRVSASVRDVGSIKMEELVDSLQADLDAIFPPNPDSTKGYTTYITGTTRIFVKANEQLVTNLLQSLALAFFIIAILMGILFRSFRMVIISLIPNLLPLVMVAGIMGFLGIALKPSTALVFGVAFGIAVDDSIHFLARYRLARRLGDPIRKAVSNSFKDTGVSMIYTSLILFAGFVSFTYSNFGGTQALGLLTSMTLGIAMFSNLIFLPVLLITFDQEKRPENFKKFSKIETN